MASKQNQECYFHHLLMKSLAIAHQEAGKAVASLGYGPRGSKIAQMIGTMIMLCGMVFVFYVFARGIASLI